MLQEFFILLVIMCIGKKGIGNRFSSQMSPNFLLQDRMDVYVCENVMVGDMHNVMSFRGPITLVVPLWSVGPFHVM